MVSMILLEWDTAGYNDYAAFTIITGSSDTNYQIPTAQLNTARTFRVFNLNREHFELVHQTASSLASTVYIGGTN